MSRIDYKASTPEFSPKGKRSGHAKFAAKQPNGGDKKKKQQQQQQQSQQPPKQGAAAGVGEAPKKEWEMVNGLLVMSGSKESLSSYADGPRSQSPPRGPSEQPQADGYNYYGEPTESGLEDGIELEPVDDYSSLDIYSAWGGASGKWGGFGDSTSPRDAMPWSVTETVRAHKYDTYAYTQTVVVHPSVQTTPGGQQFQFLAVGQNLDQWDGWRIEGEPEEGAADDGVYAKQYGQAGAHWSSAASVGSEGSTDGSTSQ